MSADQIGKKTLIRTLRATSLAVLSLFAPSAALAAISATDLTAGGASGNPKSATTASIAPGANQLVLAWVASTATPTPGVPTLSGNGLTWVIMAGAVGSRISLFRAMGASPTAGPVTIDFGSSTQKSIAWSIVEFSGVDTSGTNGSGAIVRTATGYDGAAGPSGLTITLAAPVGSGNATAGGFENVGAFTNSISPGAGYTA